MGALPSPDLPPGAHQDLVRALHELHHRAGWPSLRSLARRKGLFALAVATLSLALHRRVDSGAPRVATSAHHSVARINRAEPQRTAS